MDAAKVGPGGGRRRIWTVALVVLLAVVLLAGAFWVRLSIAPVVLPSAFQDRIETRIDRAMTSGDIGIGEMVLALSNGMPALEFRDVTLTTPQGEDRAVFPVLRLWFAQGAMMRGQLRVQRILVAGAGLNLVRGADGQLDLDLAGGGEQASVDLVQTLARLDQMFAAPAFSHLEEVLGDAVEVHLSDAVTDRDLRLHSGQARLTRDNGLLQLEVEGQLDGQRDATVALSLQRDASRGRTQVGLTFETLAARDLAATSPVFAFLDQMHAPIDGSLTADVADDGTLGTVDGWLSFAPGQLRLLGQEPLSFTALRARVTYAPDTHRARFDELVMQADQLSFTGQGHVDISADGQVLTGQANLADIVTSRAA